MRVLGIFALWLVSFFVQAKCFTIHDESNKLLYRAEKSPVSLAGSIGDAIQQRFPGAHMSIDDFPCEYFDLTSKEGIEKTKRLQETREGQFAVQYTPKPGEIGNSNSAPVGGGGITAVTNNERAECISSGDYRVCSDSYTSSSGDTSVRSWDNKGNSYSVRSWSDSGGVHSQDSRGNRCTITNSGTIIGCK